MSQDEDNKPEHDDEKIPALFATIHWRSDERPDGYTAKQVWELNNLANSHLPHLQKEWPYEDDDGLILKKDP